MGQSKEENSEEIEIIKDDELLLINDVTKEYKNPVEGDFVGIHIFTILLFSMIEQFEYAKVSLWKALLAEHHQIWKRQPSRKHKKAYEKKVKLELKSVKSNLSVLSNKAWSVINMIDDGNLSNKHKFITNYLVDKIFDNILNWYNEAIKEYEKAYEKKEIAKQKEAGSEAN